MQDTFGELDRSVETGGLRTDTLVDSVVILLGLTALQRIVGFGRAILFCRWLDPQELGQWDMAFGFVMLAAPLTVLALPGAFGRYVETYRQRGQLRTFLRRTILACVGLAAGVIVGIYLARDYFSLLVFGTPDQAHLISLLAISLVAASAFYFLLELFTALRNVRLVSGLHMVNSLSFAALGICLLLIWQPTASSVVVAYGGACLITATVAIWCLRRTWKSLPRTIQPLTHRALWSKVLPFAGWVLLADVLANLFQIVDRYMIVHCSRMSAVEALVQVGNYHSSRVVPLLLLSVAMLLSTTLTPHLSHDWEAGRRERVAARLRLFLKLVGFVLVCGAVAVLLAAPLLFNVALKGKFEGGLIVLPWTLVYCIWFGLAMTTGNYLWCAEKARLASLALLVGLAVNVGLNLLLLPRMGLLGAVLATTAANLVALVLICVFSQLLGFHTDLGTRVVFALPVALCLGPWLAVVVVLAVILEAVRSDRLLSGEEKQQLAEGYRQYLQRLKNLRLVRACFLVAKT
jgi:PST family polysaccharide transporter